MDWTESEKGYAAMITYLDSEIGKIMEKLKTLGLDENTLVIFTSDNGADSPDSFHNISNFPFRGHKRDLYEGGIRVPFIARWKGTITPGRVSTHNSAFWDLLPTVCELSGSEIPEVTDGISFLPELLGRNQRKHEYLYFEFHEQNGKQAIIKDGWKCIRLNAKDQKKSIFELYQLNDDIWEKQNLASGYPEILEELTGLMERSRTEKSTFDNFIK